MFEKRGQAEYTSVSPLISFTEIRRIRAIMVVINDFRP